MYVYIYIYIYTYIYIYIYISLYLYLYLSLSLYIYIYIYLVGRENDPIVLLLLVFSEHPFHRFSFIVFYFEKAIRKRFPPLRKR